MPDFKKNKNKKRSGELPSGLVVRIPDFHCHGPGSTPGQGTEIPQVAWIQPKKVMFNKKNK